MKFGFGKSIFFMSAAALASAMFARGFVSVFQYDIFSKCFNDPESATSYMCRNGNDLLQHGTFVLAALVFFAILFVFWRNPEQKRRTTIHAGLLSVAFFGLLVANWHLLVGLQDNFVDLQGRLQFNIGGPERPTEYGYLLLNRMGDVLAGALVGLVAWLPYAAEAGVIDASKRKEPRFELSSPTSASAAAPATKKAPTKKSAPKKKPAAKKKPAKKSTTKK